MRNPRYTFTRSQTIYGYLVETLEPYSQKYTSYILFTVLFYSISKHLSINYEHFYYYIIYCSVFIIVFTMHFYFFPKILPIATTNKPLIPEIRSFAQK
jgi:hypothetical protein